jgi:predicted DNA-binding transcriptional regulator YafY
MIVMQRRKTAAALTQDRVSRLYRFVKLLGSGPKTRRQISRHLKIDMRGFYRDFEKLRGFGVPIELHDGHYVLLETVPAALGRLPFPDPCLSVQEAILLANGKSPAHRKLRIKIGDLLGERI